jgi:hypothetical protein
VAPVEFDLLSSGWVTLPDILARIARGGMSVSVGLRYDDDDPIEEVDPPDVLSTADTPVPIVDSSEPHGMVPSAIVPGKPGTWSHLIQRTWKRLTLDLGLMVLAGVLAAALIALLGVAFLPNLLAPAEQGPNPLAPSPSNSPR